MYTCPLCGESFEKGDKICQKCDFHIESDFLFNPICPRCGKQFPDGTKLCTVDGAQLIADTIVKHEMTTHNREIMAQARDSLRGRWGIAIGAFVVYLLIQIAVQFIPGVGWLISLLISGPLSVGLCVFSLSLARRHEPQLSQIFEGFAKFGVALGAYILQYIFIFLWSLLLIIPGIIASLAYSMTFYIIAENDSIGPLEAITKSK
ncbi:MAG: DUF975 family protein, partial [Thermodesulfobacteriota bacterium]|nr:DUF975 family protein [Thermodesulfobacteriota bacterium]